MALIPRRDCHEVGKPAGVFTAYWPRLLKRGAADEKNDPIASIVLMELMAELPFEQYYEVRQDSR